MKRKNKFIVDSFIAVLLLLCTHMSVAQAFFTGKPIYQILTRRAGVYLGTTTVELFPNIAPLAVKNFDSLAGVQFFDSTAFHRVIPGFMIQGGDPNSRHGPRSTWGYGDSTQPNVNAEFSAARHLRGTLSAARDTGINSANSQFFICVAPASWLNGQYTVYGHVTAGMNIVDTIVNSPRDSTDNPLQKIEMFVTYVGSNDTVPAAPLLNAPLSGTLGVGAIRTLKWNTVSDAIIYHIEVSPDSTFSTLFKSADAGTNLYTVTGLVANTTYYWRVRTNNGGHDSPYSSIWHFSTTGVGIETYASITSRVIVSPNPSTGIFNFSNLEKENTIEIYEFTGQQICHTITKNNSITIDLAGKAKGIYFYSIISPDKKNVQKGKIILY